MNIWGVTPIVLAWRKQDEMPEPTVECIDNARAKKGTWKALSPTDDTIIFPKTKHWKTLESGRQGVHFLSKQTTTSVVQKGIANINNGK